MTTQVNDINNASRLFLSNLGNGRVAAKHFATVMQSVATSRDTTIFARDLKVVEGRKDRSAARAMRTVFSAVFPKAIVDTDKAGDKVFKIKGQTPDVDALARMVEAVEAGLSLRDTFAARVKSKPASEMTDKEKAAAKTARNAEKERKIKAYINKSTKDAIEKRAASLREKIAEMVNLADRLEKEAAAK